MKRLLWGALLATAGLTIACGGTDDAPSPAATPTTAQFDASQVITLTKEFSVLYKADTPDGSLQLKPSTIGDRVDVLCADEASWSARERQTFWRVLAECKKDESASGDATPVPYGFETLNFEWLFYPDTQRVMPVSEAAHDAQYSSPQPTTFPAPALTPVTSPMPAGTP